jgi:hypothetical protein
MGLDMTDVVIMIPGVRLADIRRGSRLLEEDRALRRANDVVVEFMLAHPIAKALGRGVRSLQRSDELGRQPEPVVVARRPEASTARSRHVYLRA